MAPALKILADPVADATAKEEAQQTIREQRALMTAAAKRAGVDLTESSRVPEAQAHAQAQAAIASGAPLDAVNKRLQEAGYAPIQAPAGKGGSSTQTPTPSAFLLQPPCIQSLAFLASCSLTTRSIGTARSAAL
jgi:hypothetical protein